MAPLLVLPSDPGEVSCPHLGVSVFLPCAYLPSAGFRRLLADGNLFLPLARLPFPACDPSGLLRFPRNLAIQVWRGLGFSGHALLIEPFDGVNVWTAPPPRGSASDARRLYALPRLAGLPFKVKPDPIGLAATRPGSRLSVIPCEVSSLAPFQPNPLPLSVNPPCEVFFLSGRYLLRGSGAG